MEGSSQSPNIFMPVALGFVTLILIFGGGVIWSVNTSIVGAVIASGRFETVVPRHLVSHDTGGIVETIYVREGERVEAGDVLVTLSANLVDLELNSITDQLTDLTARKLRLEAERDGNNTINIQNIAAALTDNLPDFSGRIDSQRLILQSHTTRIRREVELLRWRAAQTESQIEGTTEQIKAVTAELAIIDDLINTQRELQRQNLVPKSSVSTLERERLQKTAEKALLISSKEALFQQITEFKLMEDSISDQARQAAQAELDRIEPEIIKLIGQRSNLTLRRRYLEIKAPVSGQVFDLKVLGSGFVLLAGAPIATIIPDDGSLQAVVNIKARDIDQVYIGQIARIKLRTLNTKSIPLLNAEVVQIAGEVTSDPVTRSAFFKAIVNIETTSINQLDKRSLINGMEITAFIETKAETPLEYVIRPVRDYFDLAFRDR